MTERLLIGSANRDKAAELADLLADLPWTVLSLRDFPPVPAPSEDGETFEANALSKARYYSERLDLCCVADDSGLVVDALDGAPGVLSARYAGPDCTYDDNNAKLLRALHAVDAPGRTARFVCCAALVSRGIPGESSEGSHVETGAVEGRIAESCRGSNGFGYDPLFIPEGYDQTFGELDPALKQRISHRARAFRKLREYLESLT